MIDCLQQRAVSSAILDVSVINHLYIQQDLNLGSAN
jgi:hypothetical protein